MPFGSEGPRNIHTYTHFDFFRTDMGVLCKAQGVWRGFAKALYKGRFIKVLGTLRSLQSLYKKGTSHCLYTAGLVHAYIPTYVHFSLFIPTDIEVLCKTSI